MTKSQIVAKISFLIISFIYKCHHYRILELFEKGIELAEIHNCLSIF